MAARRCGGGYRKCEQAVAHILTGLLQKRQAYALCDGERFFDAAQNARLVANAEHYYRIMYYGFEPPGITATFTCSRH